MADERTVLRTTFERAALLYDEARPGYPEDLFDDIVELSAIPAGGRILEVGCGTGKATVPFARRGYRIHCIELGEQLAAVARRNLTTHPNAEVDIGTFEEWPVEEGAFDLAFAATAFHWIDPVVGYPKLAQSLKPGGSIAIFRHEHIQSARSNGAFEAFQDFYRDVNLDKSDEPGLLWPDEFPDQSAEIESFGLFGLVVVRRYAWDVEYDAASYLRLLSTYSGHINLDADARDYLFSSIANVIDTRYGGRIVKGYMSILHVARKTQPNS